MDKEGTGAADWTRILSVQADNVISAAALIDKSVLESIKYEMEPIVLWRDGNSKYTFYRTRLPESWE